MIRRPPRSTQSRSSAASDVYKRQPYDGDPARVFPVANEHGDVVVAAIAHAPLDHVKLQRVDLVMHLGNNRSAQLVLGLYCIVFSIEHAFILQCIGPDFPQRSCCPSTYLKKRVCLLYTSPSPRD